MTKIEWLREFLTIGANKQVPLGDIYPPKRAPAKLLNNNVFRFMHADRKVRQTWCALVSAVLANAQPMFPLNS